MKDCEMVTKSNYDLSINIFVFSVKEMCSWDGINI